MKIMSAQCILVSVFMKTRLDFLSDCSGSHWSYVRYLKHVP